MPTTTWASDFDLVNLGPLTTTFTAPPECTLPVQGVGLGPDAYEPDYILWNQQCDIVSAGNCLPSGSTMDDDYNSRTGQPNRGYQLYYYSPAAACPADWKTVGLVSRANDGSLSYSGVFDPSWVTRPEASVTTKTVFNPLVHRWANALGPQETGIACCPRRVAIFKAICVLPYQAEQHASRCHSAGLTRSRVGREARVELIVLDHQLVWWAESRASHHDLNAFMIAVFALSIKCRCNARTRRGRARIQSRRAVRSL
ncbi:uncharacterized protein VDAG_03879 [Verticillium dahliae VdLs.17]|uniref:Uncharacterized protein n=1 Tax=Verticillium dahliae (strain VdLs.17 / ATCC MYA-4575 / FGSC 10137) TaxID=498257 RepID=G2X0V0_VERDV|nr:uncharacterized protein VDAG_03879 [Verticillium dahliae VdLs.17]EGY22441.1 hypothetical protein VDAG_03879 [Verticillium dahliae VdLs.17]